MSSPQLPARDGTWVKASRSSHSGECVELRRHRGTVEVRDSKNPHGPVLSFSAAQFTAWLDGADDGEYGHLTD
jgi:hypothetical protein